MTDAAIAYLDTKDLLVELLDWVRDILRVDTALVLTLDESSSFLVARVARGMEEEVRRGVRIQVGQGFAGRVAAERRPLIVERLDRDEASNPALRDKGIRSLLGVPLIGRDVVIGVLHVGTFAPRRFSDEDVDLLQRIADRIALAIQATSTIAERSAVRALQRSLVPSRPPTIPGLSAAGRYIPGEGRSVGGDWYDLFALPNGQVCVAIGDVVGHGLRAAIVMGRLRSKLRAYAFDNPAPGDVLVRLHRTLQHFEPDEMATVLLATLDPSLQRVELSSAGHLPPVMAVPGKAGVQLEIPPDPPLGAPPEKPRRTTAVEMPPGSVLCLYTDGLVERRDVPIDARLDHLRQTVVAGDPEQVCTSAIAGLVSGPQPTDDDIAIVVLRRDPPQAHNALVVPAETSSLLQVRLAMRRWLGGADVADEDINDLVLAVGEAATNVVKHAYGATSGSVDVSLDLKPGEAVATVRDTGRWRPARGENRGRGLLVMERCSDEMRIARGRGGTEVTLRRRLQPRGGT